MEELMDRAAAFVQERDALVAGLTLLGATAWLWLRGLLWRGAVRVATAPFSGSAVYREVKAALKSGGAVALLAENNDTYVHADNVDFHYVKAGEDVKLVSVSVGGHSVTAALTASEYAWVQHWLKQCLERIDARNRAATKAAAVAALKERHI